MLNRSASLAMSTSVLKALPGKLDIKRHEPGILFISLPIVEHSLIACATTQSSLRIFKVSPELSCTDTYIHVDK